jgi:hypothetical protein
VSKRVYDEIAATRADVGRISGQLESITTFIGAADKTHADQEGRIRALERWRYSLPAALIAAVATFIASLIRLSGKG